MATLPIDSRVSSHTHDFIAQKHRMFIDGRFVFAASGKTFPVYNPATGEIMAHVPEAEAEDVDRAADIPLAIDMFRYMAGWATKISGNTLSLSFPGDFHSYTLREPVGVAAQIIPWNFPLAHGCLEARPRPRRRLHHRPQARRANANVRPPPRRTHPRSRLPRRSRQRPHRIRRRRGSSARRSSRSSTK